VQRAVLQQFKDRINFLMPISGLNQIGIKVLRFDDKEVYYDIDGILKSIECYINELGFFQYIS